MKQYILILFSLFSLFSYSQTDGYGFYIDTFPSYNILLGDDDFTTTNSFTIFNPESNMDIEISFSQNFNDIISIRSDDNTFELSDNVYDKTIQKIIIHLVNEWTKDAEKRFSLEYENELLQEKVEEYEKILRKIGPIYDPEKNKSPNSSKI
jgi:hypothetical protein